jgi:uncharacterized protein
MMRAFFLALMLVAPLCSLSVAQETAPASPFDGMPISKVKTLAKAGDEEAKMVLAEAYEKGRDVQQNWAEAGRLYNEVALGGNLEAQFRVAQIVIMAPKGVKQDIPAALKTLETAAAKNHARSQNALGMFYLNGTHVTKDEKKAFELIGKAAEQNLAEAENSLGLMYLRGTGTERDANQAFVYLKRAADKGDGWGLNNLGALYEKGWGVTQDMQKAKTLYEQALAKGIVAASQNLQRLAAKPVN